MKFVRLAKVLAAVVVFTVAATSTSAQTQPPPKVQVCHKAANGTFHLITISLNATPAHTAHGDGAPGQAVPDMPGFIFGENCAPTVAPPPEMPVGCYAIPNQGDFLYTGPIDTLGNFSMFFDSTDGTCSGEGVQVPVMAIMAAANETDAQSKCQALQGPNATVTITDLGTPGLIVPSAPGFWMCFGDIKITLEQTMVREGPRGLPRRGQPGRCLRNSCIMTWTCKMFSRFILMHGLGAQNDQN